MDLGFQISLIKSSIEFTMRQLWHLQGISAPREDIRGCLQQLRKYERELRAKEALVAIA